MTALDALLTVLRETWSRGGHPQMKISAVERLVDAVIAEEREACAMTAFEALNPDAANAELWYSRLPIADCAADAIRARGKR